MRIAFFTETFLPATDGVVTRLRYTIEELAKMGEEMLVVAPRYPDGGPDSYAGAPIYRVPGVPFPPYPRIKLSFAHPGVGRALWRFGPDLIHAVNPFILGPGGIYYARRLEVPLVASYHTNVAAYARYYNLNFSYNAARWWTRQLHNRAEINLCTSEATLDYLLKEGVKRIRLWPQGVDARRFHPDKASGEWRERLSDGHASDRLLLYVGRLAPEKGIERLKAILTGVPGTRLAFVGDGPARPDLEREFGDTPAVFTGVLQGEDLAAALPVVAARGGASHEIVSDEENGLLYEADSTPSLVSAVRRLFSDEGFRASLARRARETAEKRDWESSSRTLRGYYEEAMGRR